MAKIERGVDEDTEASAVQIGFVINTGIMTTFIAIMLVVLGGGFSDDSTAQSELSSVSDKIQANVIEADSLALTEDEFTGYFKPPQSGTDYTAVINGTAGPATNDNYLIVKDNDGNSVTQNLSAIVTDEIGCCDSRTSFPIEFTQSAQNIVVSYKGGGDLNFSVQRGVARNTST